MRSDGEQYEGYDAFGALFAHLTVFALLAAVIALPVVRGVG